MFCTSASNTKQHYKNAQTGALYIQKSNSFRLSNTQITLKWIILICRVLFEVVPLSLVKINLLSATVIHLRVCLLSPSTQQYINKSYICQNAYNKDVYLSFCHDRRNLINTTRRVTFDKQFLNNQILSSY